MILLFIACCFLFTSEGFTQDNKTLPGSEVILEEMTNASQLPEDATVLDLEKVLTVIYTFEVSQKILQNSEIKLPVKNLGRVYTFEVAAKNIVNLKVDTYLYLNYLYTNLPQYLKKHKENKLLH